MTTLKDRIRFEPMSDEVWEREQRLHPRTSILPLDLSNPIALNAWEQACKERGYVWQFVGKDAMPEEEIDRIWAW